MRYSVLALVKAINLLLGNLEMSTFPSAQNQLLSMTKTANEDNLNVYFIIIMSRARLILHSFCVPYNFMMYKFKTNILFVYDKRGKIKQTPT